MAPSGYIWLQADTPEAMLREMLEMSNLELQLRSQLAEEAEGRYQRTIAEQQAQLARLGVSSGAGGVAAPKSPMSFASFFSRLVDNKRDNHHDGSGDKSLRQSLEAPQVGRRLGLGLGL